MTTAIDRGAAALVEQGLAHHRGGRLQDARSRYEAALARMPRHADAWHLLGVVAMQEQRYADALDQISRAIEISPQPSYYDNLGCALRNWGKLEAAVECHEQALALDPKHFRAHNNLGMLLLQMRLPAAAAASFRKAVEINPQFAVNEMLFAVAEAGTSALAHLLNSDVPYDGGFVPAKVFVQERVVSLLLLGERHWRVKHFDPLRLPMSPSIAAPYTTDLLVLDALKTAAIEHGNPNYLKIFEQVRSTLLDTARRGQGG
jgi:tetratricopeptide (TPR) repeat protein